MEIAPQTVSPMTIEQTEGAQGEEAKEVSRLRGGCGFFETLA